jgi:hypothetical protein
MRAQPGQRPAIHDLASLVGLGIKAAHHWEEARKHTEAKTTTRDPKHIQHKPSNVTHGFTPAGPRCELSRVRGQQSTI